MRKSKLFSKIAAVAMAAVMALSVTACGGAASSQAPASQDPASGASASGMFTPGTYTGTGKGMGGDVKVEVVVDASAITSVTVTEQKETAGVADPALEKIPAAIVAAQSVGVDAIAGATITSDAIIAAVTDALTQAGGDMTKLTEKAAAPTVEKAADEEKTADVIIIGGGGAGLAAAVTASQAGSSVIVIEKMPKVGGNTILAGGALNAVDDGSETATANKDSVELHYTQTYEGGDKQGDPALIHTLVDNAWAGVEWLKSLGMEFLDGTFTVTGGMWPRAHKPVEPVGTGFFKTYNAYIEKSDNVEVMLNTTATEIKTNAEGRVDTVVATGETGNTITFHANKGVIVATGGFAKSVELRQKYNTQWPDLGESIQSTNHPGATGDAIPMMEKLGAQFVQMGNIQLLPLGDPETGSLSGNIEMDVEKRIFVNKEGNRFVDEGARRDVMTKALFEQPDTYMWIIVDAHSYPTGDEKNNFNESANELVAAGRAFKGETLEDLAKQIGVDPANLTKAVTDFNANVATKTADAFGRTLYSVPLDQGPYYAAGRVPTVHHTMGGVKINTDCQVLGANDAIIPGLYAAGEVTGGIHGSNRLGGNALTDTVVFGRIAGTSASQGK